MLEGISEDGPNETLAEPSQSEQENDMRMLEKLFKKVQNNSKVDKVKLLKQLLDQTGGTGIKTKNILTGLNTKHLHDQSSRHEDISLDQFSGGVDFLMDENILTNESREEDESKIVRTPNNNIKN